ncbi:SDR family oxidoreductase, partial [Xenorhabdus bovienii]|nr:SDR family oxidoreductase [Xenorhabdus bovienii]MDE9540492.1 SDR family oxidoreductase [Xenorhabdus bovienii]MDE9590361.1 SDR family oxidoreductase [Xenorhabdus bovienii]
MNEKILLVTGSSRGIGAATAILAANKGYSLCLNYLNDEKSAFKVRDEILTLGAKCIAVRADVSNEHQVKKMFDDIDIQLGSITHLVNNVGILKQKMPLIDMDGERFQQVLLTNVMSHFYCSSEAI